LVVTVRAVGYREPTTVSSFPVRVDCRGVQIPPGGVPSATCPCSLSVSDPTVIDNPNGSGCVCVTPSGGLPLVPVSDGPTVTTCKCPRSTLFDAAALRCLACPSPKLPVNGQCQCPNTIPCGGGTLNDSCQCTCPTGQAASNGLCCPIGTA